VIGVRGHRGQRVSAIGGHGRSSPEWSPRAVGAGAPPSHISVIDTLRIGKHVVGVRLDPGRAPEGRDVALNAMVLLGELLQGLYVQGRGVAQRIAGVPTSFSTGFGAKRGFSVTTPSGLEATAGASTVSAR